MESPRYISEYMCSRPELLDTRDTMITVHHDLVVDVTDVRGETLNHALGPVECGGDHQNVFLEHKHVVVHHIHNVMATSWWVGV